MVAMACMFHSCCPCQTSSTNSLIESSGHSILTRLFFLTLTSVSQLRAVKPRMEAGRLGLPWVHSRTRFPPGQPIRGALLLTPASPGPGVLEGHREVPAVPGHSDLERSTNKARAGMGGSISREHVRRLCFHPTAGCVPVSLGLGASGPVRCLG